MISFLTPTALPIEAATTMGVSVKGDGAIGKFGTGLKYAIAGILRLQGGITIWIDGEAFEFTASASDIRGKTFQIVHCNGRPCGFTTELGKHWEPWQLFRELASNTLDEGGRWTTEPVKHDAATTVIVVSCRAVEAADREEDVFIGERKPLVTSTNGATIYAGPSRHYYFKGIRAGSFSDMAPVTIDVHEGALSEDRLLDSGKVRSELVWAFVSAKTFDPEMLLQVVTQSEPGQFWVGLIPENSFHYSQPESRIMDFLLERRKIVRHPAFRRAMDTHLRQNGGKYQPIPMTAVHAALLAEGEALCAAVGVDPIPRHKAHFTRDMADGQLAVTAMDTRDVWFSTHLVMRGRDEFLCGYVEEALHAMTGFADCTREFQNALFSIVVSIGSRMMRPAMQEAA